MIWTKFEATDAWFFRDGRPFNAGEESWANSIFPPYPSVLYGVMRTVFFAENMGEFPKANTVDDPSSELRIKQYALYLNDLGLAFPMPADVVREKGRTDPQLLQMVDRPNGFISSYKPEYSHLLQSPFQEKADELFGKAALPMEDFKQYLLGDAPAKLAELRHYVSPEYKVGLGREYDTRQADEGMLYKVTYRRPSGTINNLNCPKKSVSVALAYEDLTLPLAGLTKFGADGKLATFSKMDDQPLPLPPTIRDGEIFKLYLSTPGIFNKGWAPLDLFEQRGLKICTASIGKPLPTGGWNMAPPQGPKPMRKAVPAGSLYYLRETKAGMGQAFINQYHGKALPCCDGLDRQGFGIAFFGKVK